MSDHALSTGVATFIAALSLPVAWCSYRFVEQPFRASHTPVKPLLIKYGVLCALMALPALFLIARHGFPNRYPELAAVEERSEIKQEKNPCLADYGATSPNLSQFCVPAGDEREGIALLGDSHAGALGSALRQLAHDANLKFYELNKASCPPLLNVTRRMLDHPGHDRQCAAFNKKVLDLVLGDSRIRTVWLAAYWSAPFFDELAGSRYIPDGDRSRVSAEQSSRNLAQGLADMISLLRASGKQVLVVQDDPRFLFDPVRRFRSELMPIRGWLAGRSRRWSGLDGTVPRDKAERSDYQRASSIVNAAAGSSAEIFDLKKNLCDANSCLFYENGLLLYTDPQHLSGAGAIQAVQGANLKNSVLSAGG